MRLIVVIRHDSNEAKLNPGMITLVATFPAATQTLLAPFLHPRSDPTVLTYSNHSLGYVFIGSAESECGHRFLKRPMLFRIR